MKKKITSVYCYQALEVSMKFSIFICLAIIASCTSAPKRNHEFIKNPKALNTDENKKLSAEMVAYDLEQIIFSLENGYSGKKFLPNNEFPALIRDLRKVKGAKTVKTFCEELDTRMDKVSDNHLNAKFDNESCFKSPNKKKANVGKNRFDRKKGPWKVDLESKNGVKALYISITRFPSHKNPEWNGFLEAVKSKVDKAKLVILDMRGNGGGDDTMGRNLSDFFAGVKLKVPYSILWSSRSPVSSQLFINAFGMKMREQKEKGKKPKPYLVKLQERFINYRDQALQGKMAMEVSHFYNKENGRIDFDKSKAINKPIYILQDAACASSCESTIDFFENNPNVATIGEPTAGYIHFGNAARLFLKNSGVMIQIPISYNAYTDGRFVEKKGIAPQIQLNDGKDAYESAWNQYLKEGPQ